MPVESLGESLGVGFLDPVSFLTPDKPDLSGQNALIQQQIELGRGAAEREEELFRLRLADAQRIREQIPGFQGSFDATVRQAQLAQQQLGGEATRRRQAEEAVLGGLSTEGTRALAPQFQSIFGTQGGGRIPPGFNVGGPLSPGADGAFTRGPQGSQDIPGFAGATTQPVQGRVISRPVGQGPAFAPSAQGVTQELQGQIGAPPAQGIEQRIQAARNVTPGVRGIEQQGQAVAGLGGQAGGELAGIRQSTLGTLGEVAQGRLPASIENLFQGAGSNVERDILERQFQNARARTIEGVGGRGGALDRNLAALEGQRALGVAGIAGRQAQVRQNLASQLFGVATQAGLGAPLEEAQLRGQAANIFGTGEAQRQAGLAGSLQSLDTALGRDLQRGQQLGRGAEQFLLARPGALTQLAALQQANLTAPGLPTALLQGTNVPTGAGFLGQAGQSIASQQQLAAQQAAAQQQQTGQIAGAALGALALFT